VIALLNHAEIAAHRPYDEEEPLLPVAGPFVSSNDALTAWVMNAAPGRICVYARISRLPKGGVGARARELRLAGLVTLLPQRPVIAGMFDYRARRTPEPFCGGTPLPDDGDLRGDELLLYELVTRLADEGGLCPPNRSFAALLGIRHEDRVTRLFDKLKRRGLIRVRWAQGPTAPFRVIEVPAIGRSTSASMKGHE
jgi:hypothetical protein